MKSLLLVFLFLTMNFLPMTANAQNTAPTAAEAQEFMTKAEAQLSDLSVKVNRASWVQENFITDDTQAMAADGLLWKPLAALDPKRESPAMLTTTSVITGRTRCLTRSTNANTGCWPTCSGGGFRKTPSASGGSGSPASS